MEETIGTQSGAAGWLFSKQAAEGFLAILLGTALIMSLVFSGTPKSLTGKAQIRNVDSVGGRITAGNPGGTSGVMGDMDGLTLKRLLKERPVSGLRLTEGTLPEQTLVLPDVSDGHVWDAVQGCMAETGYANEADRPVDPDTGKMSVPGNPPEGGVLVEPVVPENLSATGSGRPLNPSLPGNASEIGSGAIAEPSLPGNIFGIGSGLVAEQSLPGNASGMGSGTVADASMPENISGMGSGIVAEPTVPGNPSGSGAAVEPTVPGNPSGSGTVVNPAEPEEPIGGGAAVDPAVPGNPSEGGTVMDPAVPENPSGGGTIVDPAEPEGSAGGGIVEPVEPETPSGDGTAADPSVPDTGEGENGEQSSVSCFLLDEMGMLYGFLPEYAEIPDGCLTLPAECTGIRRGAFSGCGAGILELYIPAGAVTIEEGALADLVSLEWIEVESGNSGCVSDSGVLFDGTMSVLLAFPAAWMDVYSVPSYVTRIADRAFDGTSIYRLDLRECSMLSFGENVFGSSGGSGIEVAVREPELAQYAEILSGYAVTLTK